MFCVCARTGVNRTAREHLAAALALDIPIFAVVTKTDQADDDTLAATLLEARLLLATAADTATSARTAEGGLAGHTTDDTTDVELSVAAVDVDGGVFTTDDDVVRNAEHKQQVRCWRSQYHAAAAIVSKIQDRVLGRCQCFSQSLSYL